MLLDYTNFAIAKGSVMILEVMAIDLLWMISEFVKLESPSFLANNKMKLVPKVDRGKAMEAQGKKKQKVVVSIWEVYIVIWTQFILLLVRTCL